MPLTVRVNRRFAKFAADPDSVGNVIGFTTTEKFRVALNSELPLSVTWIEMVLVELACQIKGRQLKAAFVLLV